MGRRRPGRTVRVPRSTQRGRPPWGDGGRVSRGKRGWGIAGRSHDGVSAFDPRSSVHRQCRRRPRYLRTRTVEPFPIRAVVSPTAAPPVSPRDPDAHYPLRPVGAKIWKTVVGSGREPSILVGGSWTVRPVPSRGDRLRSTGSPSNSPRSSEHRKRIRGERPRPVGDGATRRGSSLWCRPRARRRTDSSPGCRVRRRHRPSYRQLRQSLCHVLHLSTAFFECRLAERGLLCGRAV